jgi:predicted DNA-binding protein
MESKHLLKTWTGSDNSRLMRNQTSMRLSTHVSAKISALCEMFPQRTKTQIINDLLSTALDELEGGLEDNHPWENSEDGLENLATQKTHYQTLVEKHLGEIDSANADATSDENAVIRKRTRREK